MSGGSVCKICATVPTGLEYGAADECREVLGDNAHVQHQRGRLSFLLHSLEELEKVNTLRSIDNYHVIVCELPEFCRDEATALQRLEALPFDDGISFDDGLAAWSYHRDHILLTPSSSATPPVSDQAPPPTSSATPPVSDQVPPPSSSATLPVSGVTSDLDLSRSGAVQPPLPVMPTSTEPSMQEDTRENLDHEGTSLEHGVTHASDLPLPARTLGSDSTRQPSFRVSCTRSGRKHGFSSMEAAGRLGAGLNRRFGWRVQMKNSDLDVLLNISDNSLSVSLALTRESCFKRNIVEFGPTTLRATIAYGLLRFAKIRSGDVVVDPMCGGGSISIEGALEFGASYHLAGDSHHLAVPRTLANFRAINEKRKTEQRGCVAVDVLRWDVCCLPLRTASVDVVVTDLPFGKRSGSKVANWRLYPQALQELGRVCRPVASRAVLLTHDTKAMSRVLQGCAFWKRHRTIWINVGGLTAGAYLLQRTRVAYSASERGGGKEREREGEGDSI